MANFLHHGDLPDGLDLGKIVAVDCEMMGISYHRDRLCLVQLSAGDGNAHLVKFNGKDYSAPNLKRLLADPAVLKLLHMALTDLAVIKHWLGVRAAPVFCTKVASRLCRTYTDRHSMKNLLEEVLNMKLAKPLLLQTSDWGAETLTQEQIDYAADDVLYLHPLREKLMALIEREGRMHLAQACFDYLPYRAELDLYGWDDSLLRYKPNVK